MIDRAKPAVADLCRVLEGAAEDARHRTEVLVGDHRDVPAVDGEDVALLKRVQPDGELGQPDVVVDDAEDPFVGVRDDDRGEVGPADNPLSRCHRSDQEQVLHTDPGTEGFPPRGHLEGEGACPRPGPHVEVVNVTWWRCGHVPPRGRFRRANFKTGRRPTRHPASTDSRVLPRERPGQEAAVARSRGLDLVVATIGQP